jgi:hypothetical protein
MRTHNTWLALAVMTVVGAATFAQQPQQEQQRQPGQMGQMSMDDMMKQCREHCQATSTSVDQTLATIRDATESNDPAKMRAALDTVEKPLAEMQEHMKMCMQMMDMMQMHGSMGGIMGGRTGGGMMSGQKQRGTSGQKSALDITFKSQPDPPKAGENTFEVTVKGPDGKPVTDGDVSVRFYMAAMESMPEMRNSISLKHVADGRYRGTGNVMMAGRWDVTVVVTKGGKEVGSRKLAITAK